MIAARRSRSRRGRGVRQELRISGCWWGGLEGLHGQARETATVHTTGNKARGQGLGPEGGRAEHTEQLIIYACDRLAVLAVTPDTAIVIHRLFNQDQDSEHDDRCD